MSADAGAGEVPSKDAADHDEGGAAEAAATAAMKQRKGILSRIWKGVFGSRREDYEKKLQHLSREEAAVHARMKRRAVRSRKLARNIIVLSVAVEVVAIAYAIIVVRSLDLNWTMKIVRTLPVVFSPGLSFVIYTAVVRLTRMLDQKDQKTLEKLRAERKAKLDELKERTNYYTTQQLIQRYDLDPAAKAAAASILASKLGAESGLKVSLGDDPNFGPSSARSGDGELVQSSGLRNRRQPLSHTSSNAGSGTYSMNEVLDESGADGQIVAPQSQMVVEHHQGPSPIDAGWLSRIAALLVGEDPSQSYALICGNCHRHNGLAKREDFPHITYYCPYCNALNTSRRAGEHESPSSSPVISSPQDLGDGSSLLRSLSNVSSASGSETIANETPVAAAE